MQEDNINFEEIGKDKTVHAEQSSAMFKKPIRGHYQNLHAELEARCAPENFMNPYEPEKVSRANELYSEILSIDKNDDEKLKSLRLKAVEELGVKFSTEEIYERLTNACNPRYFTGIYYDKERLELANRLYQQVLVNADNIFALEEIEEEAGDLIMECKGEKQNQQIIKESQRETQKQSQGDTIEVMMIIIIIILTIIFVIVVTKITEQ